MTQAQKTQTCNGENGVDISYEEVDSDEIDITTCDTTLTMKKVVNYLGVRLEVRMTLWA